MFSKSKINEPAPKAEAETPSEKKAPEMNQPKTSTDFAPSSTPKAKPPASVLSADLTVTGNMKTTGDIQIEGTVEGDIRAHLLTVGEGATVKGEIIHKTIAIESGAHFEGSVQRQEDPLNPSSKGAPQRSPSTATTSAPAAEKTTSS